MTGQLRRHRSSLRRSRYRHRVSKSWGSWLLAVYWITYGGRRMHVVSRRYALRACRPAVDGKVPLLHLYVIAYNQTLSEIMQQGIRACIRVRPGSDTDVFRIGAADDILRLLVDAHDTEFTISDLVGMTDTTRSTVWRAIDLLNHLDVIEVRKTPQRSCRPRDHRRYGRSVRAPIPRSALRRT